MSLRDTPKAGWLNSPTEREVGKSEQPSSVYASCLCKIWDWEVRGIEELGQIISKIILVCIYLSR